MLNVPDDVAQDFGEKVKGLLSEFDIEADNDGVLDCLLPITERVKTFEDACKVLGARAERGDDDAGTMLADYESNADNIKTSGIVAFMKLCIITAALNEGWKPTFTDNEYRWFPWFRYYTKEEIEEMTEEKKQKLGLVGACAGAAYGSRSGLAYVISDHGWSFSHTSFGSRLAYKSEALADYSGKQFKDIWVDYVGKF